MSQTCNLCHWKVVPHLTKQKVLAQQAKKNANCCVKFNYSSFISGHTEHNRKTLLSFKTWRFNFFWHLKFISCIAWWVWCRSETKSTKISRWLSTVSTRRFSETLTVRFCEIMIILFCHWLFPRGSHSACALIPCEMEACVDADFKSRWFVCCQHSAILFVRAVSIFVVSGFQCHEAWCDMCRCAYVFLRLDLIHNCALIRLLHFWWGST